ncbi:MAG: SUMF1/EgtB/PvdO family nonheme iron enzyme [Desulfobacteraceae bacterium]|nr:SUMF1/EgtB/PvdO family nonheme iron enzyme [Desulfobacteraceae bacterium]
MHGNVWEWCQDWDGDYPSSPVINPTGPPSGVYKVIRGGSFCHKVRICRSAHRYRAWPEGGFGWGDDDIGFRLVRTV